MNSTLTSLLFFCDVQTFRAGGRGGQHQNKTESAVRLVHRPTGISVICRDERSQHLNKMRCLEILQRKIALRNEKPKPRIPTAISHSQKLRRVEKKRIWSAKKKSRRRPEIED